jgi:ABC-type phosphate transport system permease subunit
MVTGNAVQVPHSPLDPLRTLTANLALEMAYAADDHRAALFATAIVLFLGIVLLNSLAGLVRGRQVRSRALVAPSRAPARQRNSLPAPDPSTVSQ